MINYSCKKFKTRCLMIVGAVVVLLSSCTDVNDLLGLDYVPDNQGLKVGITSTLDGVMTTTSYTDSIVATNQGGLLLGKAYSSTYGRTKMGFLTQYSPYYSTNTEDDEDGYTPFGLNPVVDSLILNLYFVSAFEGDSTVEQDINIYTIKGDFSIDSVYYSNFDYSEYLDEYLGTFYFAGTNNNEAFSIPLDKDFAETLFYSEDGSYTHDTLFIDRFNGLAFLPTEESPDGSLYSISAGAMAMNLHYRNFDTDGAVYDTCYYTYYFDNSYTTYNVSVTLIEHDYTDSQVTIQSETAQEVTYVQGYAGVTTLLTFNEDFIEELRSLAGEGTEYTDIAINKAKITFYTVDSGEDAHEYSPSRLGMYTDYRTFSNITDYSFDYEDTYGIEIPYDGYLDGSLNQYSMDITTHFSYLVSGDYTSMDVTMGTTYSQQTGFYHVALNGSASEKPPLLEVTYTLVK